MYHNRYLLYKGHVWRNRVDTASGEVMASECMCEEDDPIAEMYLNYGDMSNWGLFGPPKSSTTSS
jgi:hypothetical protein